MASEPPEVRRRLTRRWVAEALGVFAGAVAGAVLMVISEPVQTVYVIGIVVLGFSLTIGTALVFYEVGRSEDRARAAGRH